MQKIREKAVLRPGIECAKLDWRILHLLHPRHQGVNPRPAGVEKRAESIREDYFGVPKGTVNSGKVREAITEQGTWGIFGIFILF